ncbi:MAG TPA: PEGA domain-containing protein, partial [Polyangiaceae bacterium]
KGKLAYMAPEQLLGEKIDRRADVFAVGCMLWEAATGFRMWEDVSEANLMHRLATGDIPNPSDRTPLEPELQRIIEKATAPSPEDRYATALELQRDLSAYLAATGTGHALREIGATLAEIFQAERDKQREAIRVALRSVTSVSKLPANQEDEAEISADQVEAAPLPRPARKRWVAAVLAFVVLAGLAGAIFLRSRAQPKANAHVDAAAASVPVTIAIRATPPDATIEVDGKETGVASVVLNVEANANDHFIRVIAPGFSAQTNIVKFDRTQDIEVRLEPLAKAPEPAPVASEPPAIPRVTRRNVAPKKKTAPPPDDRTCSPPYYFSQGIKVYKPQCL